MKIKALRKIGEGSVTLHRSGKTLGCIRVYGYPLDGEKPYFLYKD